MQNPVCFEPLEDRLLLSGGLNFSTDDGSQWNISGKNYVVCDEAHNPINSNPVSEVNIDVIGSSSSVSIKYLGGGSGVLPLGDINGLAGKITINGSVNGGEFNIANLSALTITGSAEHIRVNSTTTGKITLGDIVNSEIFANTIKSFSARNVVNTDIAAGINSVNGIFGDADDVAFGKNKALGSVKIASYYSDSPHAIIGSGAFTPIIGTEKFQARFMPRNYGAGVVRSIYSPRDHVISGIDYSFAVLTDLHTNPPQQVIDIAASNNPEFAVLTGDIVQGSSPANWSAVTSALTPLSSQGPIEPVPGNHDQNTDPSFSGYRATFGDDKLTYSFKSDGITHFVLNSTQSYAKGSAQYSWLENELSKADTPFIFVELHHPPKDQYFFSLLQQYEQKTGGQALVFSGHIHSDTYSNKYEIDCFISAKGKGVIVSVDTDGKKLEVQRINSGKTYVVNAN